MSNIVGCIFICDETKKTLLLKRTTKDLSDRHRGFWSILTGHMDEGELPYQSVDREVYEEIGVPKNSVKFTKFKIYNYKKDGYLHLYYVVTKNEFIPDLNEENEDYGWFDIDDLPKPLFPSTKEKIENVLTLL
jgi:8-oxo-dGTP pyrophosphatase MutT (NUDIX family)